MADPVRHGPVEGLRLVGRHGTEGGDAGCLLRALYPASMAQIAGAHAAAARDAACAALEIPDPAAPRRCAAGDGVRMLWNGPGQFLVVSRRHRDAELAAELGVALAGAGAVAVDVSHARTVLRVRGPACRDVLAKGCPLDVDAMQPGDCAATLVSHFNVLVHCDATDAFELYVSRSLAAAFLEWLLHAGMEYGVEVSAVAP